MKALLPLSTTVGLIFPEVGGTERKWNMIEPGFFRIKMEKRKLTAVSGAGDLFL